MFTRKQCYNTSINNKPNEKITNEKDERAALDSRLEAQRARVNRLKAMMAQLEIDLDFERSELARLERCTLVEAIDDAFLHGTPQAKDQTEEQKMDKDEAQKLYNLGYVAVAYARYAYGGYKAGGFVTKHRTLDAAKKAAAKCPDQLGVKLITEYISQE